MAPEPPPPPPPPHGQNPRPPGGLPDGNYDIFIIPPHSAGGGFLYLPSLRPHRNSFLAGVACTLLVVALYTLAVPVLKQWLSLVMAGGGGIGVLGLIVAVAVGAWALGKTQAESEGGPRSAGGGTSGSSSNSSHDHHYQQHYAKGPSPNAFGPDPPPQPEPGFRQTPPAPEPESQPKATPNSSAANGWEKAREETRRREEERRRAEDLRKKREEAQRQREEAEKAAKAKAEKEKWEQARAREKEQREREARERISRERLQREKESRERDAKEKADREKAEREKAAREQLEQQERGKSGSARTSPSKGYQKPSARSHAGTEDAHSYRPYDSPTKSKAYASGASSVSGLSESSYAASQSTARTTPPPSHRGPYSTKDPDKIQIRGVYLLSDSFPTKPIAQLVAGQGAVTDGLVLYIKTEGLFIDDDVRGVAQREWDVKAWTLKLVENGKHDAAGGSLHIFRATTRDGENKKYTFLLDESEAWKVDMGISRLKKGSQVRSLNTGSIKNSEVKTLLLNLGWT